MILKENAYAKINLFLDVLDKREDGFHNLLTLMHRVSLYDEITIECLPSEQTTIQIEVDGAENIPTGADNLVYKAAALYLETLQRGANITIHLKKHIPSMAGLGGGSSDAATVLKLLNKAFYSPLDAGKLHELALQIGSDVPFFISQNKALCSGRGEIFHDIDVPAFEGEIVIVEGKEPSFTGVAFRTLDEDGERTHPTPDFSCFSYVDVYNAFESVVAKQCPSVAEHIEVLGKLHPLCVAMSGSGSSVFAVFQSREEASHAMSQLKALGSSVHLCTFL